jgi:hypothetical protein
MQRGTWKRTTQHYPSLVAVALGMSLVAISNSCARAPRPPVPLTGALPKHLNDMTNGEFAQFVAQLRWSDSTDTTRRCDTSGAVGEPCRGDEPTAFTRARIYSESTSHLVGDGYYPRNGTVVWRLVNLGRRVENRYKLRPDTNVSYYVVVFPPGFLRRRATWRMVEVDRRAPPATREAPVATHMRDVYRQCNDRPHPYRRKRVLFAWCPGEEPRRPAGMFTPVAQIGIIDSPGWGECSSGCCTGGR